MKNEVPKNLKDANEFFANSLSRLQEFIEKLRKSYPNQGFDLSARTVWSWDSGKAVILYRLEYKIRLILVIRKGHAFQFEDFESDSVVKLEKQVLSHMRSLPKKALAVKWAKKYLGKEINPPLT